MATAKKTPAASAAAKKTATSGSRALTLWEQKFAAAAERSANAEKDSVGGGLQGISLRNGVLSVDDQPVPGNELDVVVLCAVHENKWYAGDYDPDTPQIPACYAFRTEEEADEGKPMAPHAESTDPQGDADGQCEGCEHNQWGSADRGRGKACKNIRRLALVTSDSIESANALEEAEVRTLSLPVTSVRAWATYVRNTLATDLGRPYWGVVTNIKVVPDKKTQFRVVFTLGELIDFDDALFTALEKRQQATLPELVKPYILVDREDEPPARPARGSAPKKGTTAPLKPVGRAAQAMQKAVAAKPPAAAPATKRSKF